EKRAGTSSSLRRVGKCSSECATDLSARCPFGRVSLQKRVRESVRQVAGAVAIVHRGEQACGSLGGGQVNTEVFPNNTEHVCPVERRKGAGGSSLADRDSSRRTKARAGSVIALDQFNVRGVHDIAFELEVVG